MSLSYSGQSFPMHTDDFNLGRLSADSECVVFLSLPFIVPLATGKTDERWYGYSMCVGSILSFADATGFPGNLAIIGDVFLKSCA